MNKIKLLFFTLLLVGNAFSQSESQMEVMKKFKEKLDATDLIFQMPKGYHFAEIKENKDMSYDYAIFNPDSTMEIRYTVWSLKEAVVAYNDKIKKNPKEKLIHPNAMYKAMVQASMVKLSGGINYEIKEFPKESVEAEFLADAGGSCFFSGNSEFMKGYQYGQFLFLHRDNVADIIVTFLSNDKEKHSELMKIPFRSVGFKEVHKKIEMK